MWRVKSGKESKTYASGSYLQVLDEPVCVVLLNLQDAGIKAVHFHLGLGVNSRCVERIRKFSANTQGRGELKCAKSSVGKWDTYDFSR